MRYIVLSCCPERQPEAIARKMRISCGMIYPILVWMMIAVFCCNEIYNFTSRYMQYETTSKIEIKYQDNMTIPTVIYCIETGYSGSSISFFFDHYIKPNRTTMFQTNFACPSCKTMDYTRVLAISGAEMEDLSQSQYKIYSGIDSFNNPDTNRHMTTASRIVTMNFNPTGNDTTVNDISLFQTVDQLMGQAGALSTGPDVQAGSFVTTSGFGSTTSGPGLSDYLKAVNGTILPDANCSSFRNSQYDASRFYNATQSLCAAFGTNSDSAPCFGDSGNGLITYINDRPVIVGLLSYTFNCTLYGFPSYFTRVGAFLDFIHQYVPSQSNTSTQANLSEFLVTSEI
jgi:hypothetical protein